MRPLDLPRAMSSLLPRVLAMLLPTGLANSLQPAKGRTDGSRFRASRLGDSLPEGLLFKLDLLQARITGHSEAITFVLARGMMGFSIRRCGDSPAPPIPPRPDEALENTYVVFSFSPVRLLHPSLWGFSSFSYRSSPR